MEIRQLRSEGRVGQVARQPRGPQERQVPVGEVARSPCEHPRVECDDDRAVSGRLGPRDEAPATSRSRGQYSWYQRRPAPFAAATSSIVNEETPLRIRGTPVAAAARATASSPSAWRMPWTPIGASSTGAARRAPSMSTDRSRCSTSTSMRGTIRQRRKASRFARIVSSEPAPPATYPNASASRLSRACASMASGVIGSRRARTGAGHVDAVLVLGERRDDRRHVVGHGSPRGWSADCIDVAAAGHAGRGMSTGASRRTEADRRASRRRCCETRILRRTGTRRRSTRARACCKCSVGSPGLTRVGTVRGTGFM